jgi:predicted nucleotidyltransferase
VKGKAKPYSDLDLAVMDNRPSTPREVAKLKTAFSESKLPFKVDVLEWNNISEEFKKIVEREYQVIQEGTPHPQI